MRFKSILAGRARRGRDNPISPEPVVQTIQFLLHTLAVLFFFSFCSCRKYYKLSADDILRHCNWSATAVGNDNRHLITHTVHIHIYYYIFCSDRRATKSLRFSPSL